MLGLLTLLPFLPHFAPDGGGGDGGSAGASDGGSAGDGSFASDLMGEIGDEANLDPDPDADADDVDVEQRLDDLEDVFSASVDGIIEGEEGDDPPKEPKEPKPDPKAKTGAKDGEAAPADAAKVPDPKAEAGVAGADGAADGAAADAPEAFLKSTDDPRAVALVGAVKTAIPDAVVATPEDVVTRLTATDAANREMRETQDRMAAVLDRHPPLQAVILALEEAVANAKPGEEALSLEEALAAHVEGVDVAVPDGYDDPKARDAAMQKKGRIEALRTQRAKDAADHQAYLDDYFRQARVEAAEFVKENGWTPAEAETFFRQMRTFEEGDPETRRLIPPKEKFTILRQGYAYTKDVAKAREEGIAEGRRLAAEELKGRRTQAHQRPSLRSSAADAPQPRRDDGKFDEKRGALVGDELHSRF